MTAITEKLHRAFLRPLPWLFACSAPPARARDPEPVPEVALAPMTCGLLAP